MPAEAATFAGTDIRVLPALWRFPVHSCGASVMVSVLQEHEPLQFHQMVDRPLIRKPVVLLSHCITFAWFMLADGTRFRDVPVEEA